MDMRKYSGGGFLKVDDLRSGPRRLTIATVKQGNYDRPDAHFSDGSILSLNATNVRTLIKSYGPDSAAWVHHEVELQLGTTQFQGAPTETIIVTAISPPLSAAELKTAHERKPPEFDDEVPF